MSLVRFCFHSPTNLGLRFSPCTPYCVYQVIFPYPAEKCLANCQTIPNLQFICIFFLLFLFLTWFWNVCAEPLCSSQKANWNKAITLYDTICTVTSFTQAARTLLNDILFEMQERFPHSIFAKDIICILEQDICAVIWGGKMTSLWQKII